MHEIEFSTRVVRSDLLRNFISDAPSASANYGEV